MEILKPEERLKRRLDNIKINPHLTSIDLSDLELKEIPVEIFSLKNLRKVNLSKNQISNLPLDFFQLTNLEDLDLSHNNLRKLPIEIGNFKNAISLKLNNNKIEELPTEIGNMTSLYYLFLNDNLIKTIPDTFINFKNIVVLFLNSNRIEKLPDNFLNVAENLLKNNLSQRKESALTLHDNEFRIPKKIYEQDLKTVIQFILNLQGTKNDYLNEAKIIILGDGYAGKTALVEQLKYGTFRQFGDTNITRGIKIEELDIYLNDDTKIKTKLWDFGGQEVMHAMHQFFMTERSLYLLAWNAREDDPEGRLEDWIKLIQAFGGDSPIIIVINKTDDGNFHPDEEHLLNKYRTNIRGIIRTSCKLSQNGSHGINHLKKMISQEFEKFEYLKERIPFTWQKIKSIIESHEENYISLSEYYKICEENNEQNEVLQNSLLRLLHDLGIAFNYGELTNPDSTNILKPDWVTKGIYDIINSNKLFQTQGRVKIEDLHGILTPKEDYPQSKHKVIIGLMERFELCFRINKDEFLIPDLLNVAQPHISNEFEEGLKLQYHYDYFPKSIFPRFIVKVHELSRENWYWRFGVVIEKKYPNQGNNQALITNDKKERKVYISIIGNEETRRKLLNEVRMYFDLLHQEIKNLKPQTFIPYSEDNSILENYNHLLTLERKGIFEFIPRGLDYSVPINAFLKDVKRSKDLLSQKDAPEELLQKFTERQKKLMELTSEKILLDERANKEANIVRIAYYTLLVIALGVIGYFSIKNWEYWESKLTVGLTTISLLSAFFFRKYTPEGVYKSISNKKKKEYYKIAKFDAEDFEELSIAVHELKKKLNKYLE